MVTNGFTFVRDEISRLINAAGGIVIAVMADIREHIQMAITLIGMLAAAINSIPSLPGLVGGIVGGAANGGTVSPPGSNTAVGDSVVFAYSAYDCLYGLSQPLVGLNALTIDNLAKDREIERLRGLLQQLEIELECASAPDSRQGESA